MASHYLREGDHGRIGTAAIDGTENARGQWLLPQPQPRGGHSLFDRQLAAYLWDQMHLVLPEAAHPCVLSSSFSLVLLPDIAASARVCPNGMPFGRFIQQDVLIGTSTTGTFSADYGEGVRCFGPELLHRLIKNKLRRNIRTSRLGGNIRVAALSAPRWCAR